MTAGGVPGFFGRKKRTTRPVGVEISIAYDTSGSMDFIREFLDDGITMQNIQLALIAENIGVQQENRYAKSDFIKEFTFDASTDSSGLWLTGAQVASNTSLWDRTDGGGNLGTNVEDVTGVAYALATLTRRNYRSGIERIIINASDEQEGNAQTNANALVGALTAANTRQRHVALSGMSLAITPAPAGVPVGFVPFGYAYTDQTSGVAIYKQNNADAVRYYNVPVANATWTSDGVAWPLDGSNGVSTGIVRPDSGNLNQLVNTPYLAYETGGAVYDIEQIINGVGLRGFSDSLGQVLGRFLYEQLS